MAIIKAVEPYRYEGALNFKDKAFYAWKDLGYKTQEGYYPTILRWLLFRKDILPTLLQKEKKLVYVQPVSLYFDTGFTVLTNEIIPLFWDCWPCFYDKVETWLKKHKVKTAIFTSLQEMAEIKRRLPDLNVIHCPEGVDTSIYKEGKELKYRDIDILEFGRPNNIISSNIPLLNTVRTAEISPRLSDQELREMMENAKITICFPRNITHPEETGNVETLTQRYWEAMLSRMVIIGHCPQELKDLIGYNPVIEYDYSTEAASQIENILCHIEDYQSLVDKNRYAALKHGDWKIRMRKIYDEICLS
jgi:hypothetical protein